MHLTSPVGGPRDAMQPPPCPPSTCQCDPPREAGRTRCGQGRRHPERPQDPVGLAPSEASGERRPEPVGLFFEFLAGLVRFFCLQWFPGNRRQFDRKRPALQVTKTRRVIVALVFSVYHTGRRVTPLYPSHAASPDRKSPTRPRP